MSFTAKMFRMVSGKADAKRDANLVVPEDVTAVYDINYAGNADAYNLLDVYYPKDTDHLLPVIVSIHGGGYVYGTKEIYKYYGMYLAQQGFTFVNFNYHLAPEAKFPTQLTETNMVMEWMCDHADEYHLDLNNVILVGDSAGSQMTSQYAAIATNADYAKLFPFTVPEEIKIRALGLNCGMYTLTILGKDGKANKMNKELYGDYLGKDFDFSNEKIDVLKTVTMLLIHDIVEIDAGDTYAYDEEGKKTQREREVKAADRIFGILPDDQRDNFRNLWEEFEKGETPEAKFAHTMDNFQPAMLNDLTEGKSWVEKGVHLSQILERNKNTAAGSKEIWDYAYKNIFEKNVEAGKIKKDN